MGRKLAPREPFADERSIALIGRMLAGDVAEARQSLKANPAQYDVPLIAAWGLYRSKTPGADRKMIEGAITAMEVALPHYDEPRLVGRHRRSARQAGEREVMPSLSRRQVVTGAAALVAAAGAEGFVGFAAEPSAAPPSDPLPMAALKADLAVWRRAVLERHPRYYGQTMLEAPVEAAFRTAAASIEGALTRAQAFRYLCADQPDLSRCPHIAAAVAIG